MPEPLAQRDLRNNNAGAIDAVVAGKTFIVTHNGEPVAELRPIPHRRRTFVPRHELIAAAAKGHHIDRAVFEAELDAAIDQSL